MHLYFLQDPEYYKKKLPLSLRDIPPHPDAIRINSVRKSGVPDGIHTGGTWILGNSVWKPLDCKESLTADALLPTREAEFLYLMRDLKSFPPNWGIEEANGKLWLTRDIVKVLYKDFKFNDIWPGCFSQIESDIKEVNRRGWQLNDAILLGFNGNQFFILDCSAAAPESEAYEEEIYEIFIEKTPLLLLRSRAQQKLDLYFQTYFGYNMRKMRHVYASFARYIDYDTQPKIPQPPKTIIYREEIASWEKQIPWSWILSENLIVDTVVDIHQLIHAYTKWECGPKEVKK